MAELVEGPHATIVEQRTIDRDDCELPVVHARCEGMPRAGIVLHPDIMGLRPLFDDMARRIASHGFAVCAVEPFARHSDAERTAASDGAARFSWIPTLGDDQQLGDLEAAAD